jgi:hypothetical protein
MTKPDLLSSKISELKDWQTVAWRRIADPSVTLFERRELRNHLKDADAELRLCLGMRTERLRFRARSAEAVGDSLTSLKLRLLS